MLPIKFRRSAVHCICFPGPWNLRSYFIALNHQLECPTLFREQCLTDRYWQLVLPLHLPSSSYPFSSPLFHPAILSVWNCSGCLDNDERPLFCLLHCGSCASLSLWWDYTTQHTLNPIPSFAAIIMEEMWLHRCPLVLAPPHPLSLLWEDHFAFRPLSLSLTNKPNCWCLISIILASVLVLWGCVGCETLHNATRAKFLTIAFCLWLCEPLCETEMQFREQWLLWDGVLLRTVEAHAIRMVCLQQHLVNIMHHSDV